MDHYTNLNLNQIPGNYGANYYDASYYNNYSNTPSPSSFQTLDPRLKFYNEPLEDSSISNKSDDELWVETWLSKIGKIDINLDSTIEIRKVDVQKKSAHRNVVKISAARAAFANSLGIINKLQEAQDYLKTNVATISSAEWKKHTVEIGVLKDELVSLLSQFENTETLKQLQYDVGKRKKKRLGQRKRKLFLKEKVQQEKEELQRVHKEIDLWLEGMKESVERAKTEERMKKDADCVLAEVTKKKSEARKHLSLISALVKLRNIREQVKQQRGEKTSLEDHRAFLTSSEKLTKMWEDAFKIYLKEEQTLRVMLELNAAEDNNAIKLSKEKKIQEWEEVLFGKIPTQTPLYWGLMSAERDMETFIAIRRSWDTFLAQPYDEHGSKMPIGWVLPNPNPNECWSQYLLK